MNKLTILYIAILCATYQSPVDTAISVLILLIHDFTQHVILTSHKWEDLVSRPLQNRMLLSATAGVQLYLTNLMFMHAMVFMPLVVMYQQLAEARQFGNPFMIIGRSLIKFYRHRYLDSVETVIALLSVMPRSVVQTMAYWLSSVTYGNMSIRRAYHGSRVESVCLDDVIANSLVSALSLLTGQSMLRMVGSVVSRKASGSVLDMYMKMYREDAGGALLTYGAGFGEILTRVCMGGFDVASNLSCQGIVALGVARKDVFGKKSETRRSVVKVFVAEVLFGVLRVGMSASWGLAGNIGCALASVWLLAVMCAHGFEKYRELRTVEEKRERALTR